VPDWRGEVHWSIGSGCRISSNRNSNRTAELGRQQQQEANNRVRRWRMV